MEPTQNVLGLIQLLYAAPGTLDGWHTFLESLRAALQASVASVTFDPVVGLVEPGRGALSAISADSSEHREGLSEQDAALLSRLAPHVRRALQLHRRLVVADTATEDIGRVLNSSPQAVLLVDTRSRVVFMNQAASRLTGMHDGLTMHDGELRAVRAADTTRLRSLIARGVNSSSGDGSGGVTVIRRASGRRPLAVLVCPVSRQRALFAGVKPAVAAVFVADPEQMAVPPDDDTLRTLFGFTPAEAKLTRLLAHGASLGDAAGRLGVTRETVRTRIKTIFEKTNTHRQAELVRLVMNATPTA